MIENLTNEDESNMTEPKMKEPQCEHCISSGRTKERSDKEYRNLMNRLKRIEGQIRGVQGMLENNAYCPDILIQVSSINAALNSFNKELMAQHIKSCVKADIQSGDDAAIDEFVKVMQKLMR